MPRTPLQRLVAPRQVPAGDMAELVGDHRAELVDRAELGHQPGVDEDVLPAGHEGVRLAVVDDVDLHRGRIDPGGAEERVGDPPERVLDLGVADQAPRRRLSGRERHRHRQHARQEPQRRLLRPMAQARAAAASPATRGRGLPSIVNGTFAGARGPLVRAPAARGERMRRSHRGEVDPFIVMDVMEAARAAEAAGASVIHMEVGQPGTPAPAAARAALAARHGGGRARLHRGARPARASRRASRGSTATGTGSTSTPAGWW